MTNKDNRSQDQKQKEAVDSEAVDDTMPCDIITEVKKDFGYDEYVILYPDLPLPVKVAHLHATEFEAKLIFMLSKNYDIISREKVFLKLAKWRTMDDIYKIVSKYHSNFLYGEKRLNETEIMHAIHEAISDYVIYRNELDFDAEMDDDDSECFIEAEDDDDDSEWFEVGNN